MGIRMVPSPHHGYHFIILPFLVTVILHITSELLHATNICKIELMCVNFSAVGTLILSI